jgi:serine protease Do
MEACALLLGGADAVAKGQGVFATGSPLGLDRTATESILSPTPPMSGGLYLETTAQISPSNSGGPLSNMRGEDSGVDFPAL